MILCCFESFLTTLHHPTFVFCFVITTTFWIKLFWSLILPIFYLFSCIMRNWCKSIKLLLSSHICSSHLKFVNQIYFAQSQSPFNICLYMQKFILWQISIIQNLGQLYFSWIPLIWRCTVFVIQISVQAYTTHPTSIIRHLLIIDKYSCLL